MASVRRLSSPRSGPLVLLLGFGGMAVAAPRMGLPSGASPAIADGQKEVIDQVWQIVYRDYLDSSGAYSFVVVGDNCAAVS